MGRTSDARERMIRAALDLILGESYSAATVEAICLRAGVQKGSFYHFFPSRSRLVVEALEADWQQTRPHLDAAFSPLVSPLERIRRFCRIQLEAQEGERRRLGCVIGCILARVASSLGPDEVEIRDVIRRSAEHVLRYLESAIRDGQRQGEIRRGSPKELARLFFEQVEGALGVARIMNDLESMKGLEERALALLAAPRAVARAR